MIIYDKIFYNKLLYTPSLGFESNSDNLFYYFIKLFDNILKGDYFNL